MEKTEQTLSEALDSGSLIKIIFAGKRRKSQEYRKVVMRPVSIKGETLYQTEYHFDKKVTHSNIPRRDVVGTAMKLIAEDFKQVNILTETGDIQILASKPERPRITINCTSRQTADLSHNKKKNYIIEDGVPCDFLIKLGVMSPDGRVVKKHYSKFRQINRFLEIADDCFSYLPDDRTLRVIDFGCGKSYLTFALYYYLKLVKHRDVEITGLDLKRDVIEFCSRTADELGYDGLMFLTGDIADYESDGADMVVTLHACDTATDYALANAVRWKSRVILSVPCCQHELFSQIKSPVDEPMLKHGIIKDKFTELLTDGLRGLKLEARGYDVSMIEFTSLEHTARNIMIKAVKTDLPSEASMAKASREYEALKEAYNVRPMADII